MVWIQPWWPRHASETALLTAEQASSKFIAMATDEEHDNAFAAITEVLDELNGEVPQLLELAVYVNDGAASSVKNKGCGTNVQYYPRIAWDYHVQIRHRRAPLIDRRLTGIAISTKGSSCCCRRECRYQSCVRDSGGTCNLGTRTSLVVAKGVRSQHRGSPHKTSTSNLPACMIICLKRKAVQMLICTSSRWEPVLLGGHSSFDFSYSGTQRSYKTSNFRYYLVVSMIDQAFNYFVWPTSLCSAFKDHKLVQHKFKQERLDHGQSNLLK